MSFVLDHLAGPPIASGDLSAWGRALLPLAELPNVSAKISGLVTEADWLTWSIDDLRHPVELAVDAFGPIRLMLGSDWPVCLLAGSYTDAIDSVRYMLAELPVHEQDEIRGGTAVRIYRLDHGPGAAVSPGESLVRRLIIAHDLGTSGDKASLHDADGRLLASHTVHYPADFGPGGKAEQDPDDWWAAFCEGTRALLSETGARPGEVACVTLCGQMQGLVLIDRTDRPLRPAIIWADTRAQAERDTLAGRLGDDRAFEIMGHRLDATYTLPKAMWVRAHEPETFARADGILIAKDYVTLRATGRRCTDPSDACGTNAYDQRAGTWSEALLAAAELDAALLPELLPSTTVAGGLTADAAAATGLDSGTPVVVGGGDGACAALGAGLVAPESGANATLGSSAWLSVATDAPGARSAEAHGDVRPRHRRPLPAARRDAVRRRLDRLAGRDPGRVPWSRPRSPADRRRRGRGCLGRPVLPALPDGRAGTHLGRAGPRHLRRPGSAPWARAPRARRPRGGRLQPRLDPAQPPRGARDGSADRAHRGHRRGRAQ